MKTTHEIKHFIKSKLGIVVVGNTSSGKSKWQSFRIRPEPHTNVRDPLVYSAEFPVAFRQACLKVVYPNHPSLHQQTRGGNVGAYSIAMLPHEWEQVIAEWPEPVRVALP